MDVESLIVGELTKAQEQIRSNMSSKGINASGRTSDSLRVEKRSDCIVLVMGGDRAVYGKTAPLQTLEIGSRPGIRGSWFKSVIYHWAEEKGIPFENDSHRWAFATVVARNIESEGTARYKSPVDVYSTIVKNEKEEIKSIIKSDFRALAYSIISK